MRRFRWWCGAVVLSVAATGAAGVAPAGAAGLGCGSVVTGSVVLQADLVNCPADGLIVGAPGTRIDLNGRTIGGTNSAGSVGIRVNGHHDVTIVSGAPFASIAEFTVGIRANNTRRLSVSDVTTQAVVFGLRLEHSTGASIRGNNLGFAQLVPDCAPGTAPAGIRLFDSHGNTIRDNAAQLTGYGILLIQSDTNTVRGNGAAPPGSDGNSCIGIAMVSSDRNVVVANRATENRGGDPVAGDGIVVDAASRGNALRDNSASTNSDDGIDVRSPSTRLVNNVATANDDLGMIATVGVVGRGNRASGNGNPLQCVNVTCTR